MHTYICEVIECSTDGSCPCDVVLADHDPLGGTSGPRRVDQSSTVARLLTLNAPLNLIVRYILRKEEGEGEGEERERERERESGSRCLLERNGRVVSVNNSYSD